MFSLFQTTTALRRKFHYHVPRASAAGICVD